MKCLLIVLALAAIASASIVGIAHLKGTAQDPTIDGTVYFVQLNTSYVWVWANVSGITHNFNSLHGMHVHQYGDLFDQTAGTSLSTHYVGRGSPSHSCEPNMTRHEGDMGNWQVTDGAFLLTKTLDLLDLNGATSIIGKGIVFHNATDDCGVSGDPAGRAGVRLAIGVVGIANPDYYPAAVTAAIASISDTPKPNNAISADTNPIRATAILTPTAANTTSFPNVAGIVVFEQDATGAVTVTAKISGLTPGGAYGIHIHTFADYYTNGVLNGLAAGGHYNSTPVGHAGPLNDSRHNGDLGNICSFDQAGFAYYQWTMTDGKFSLNGANNVLGRNIIIHSIYDAMTPTAPLGQRVSIGVLGVSNNSLTAASRIALPSTFTSDPLCASIPTVAPSTAPTATPTPTPTSSPNPTSSPTPTSSPNPTSSPTPTSSPNPTSSPTPSTKPTTKPSATSTTGSRVSTTSSASSVVLATFVFVAAIVALF